MGRIQLHIELLRAESQKHRGAQIPGCQLACVSLLSNLVKMPVITIHSALNYSVLLCRLLDTLLFSLIENA